VAIIDGNGRWAAARCLPPRRYRRGVEALRRRRRAANELGHSLSDDFSFSSKTGHVPDEIGDLFGLLRRFHIRHDLATLHRDGFFFGPGARDSASATD